MTDDQGGDTDPNAPTVQDKKRANVDPLDALLREVAAAPSPPPAPWEMLEQKRYRILDLLGSGGGGQVYKAYDEQLGRHIALKFLNTLGDDQAAQLVKEARTQARVKHPGVCQVYEVVEGGGHPFIAMQLIEGPTLGAAKLSQPEKVDILRRVSEAVDAAHQFGIVHRDLKPSNIMLEQVTDGWRPFVMDFGLAREVDKTLTSGMVGTPQFMAPEQARGDVTEIGPCTDIWALGATLYTMLVGRPPFDGDSMMEILRHIELDEPPPLPSLPRELQAIVLRCLEKSPHRRYPTAAALARDLGAFAKGDPVTARRRSLGRRVLQRASRHRASVAIVLAAIAVAAAAMVTLRRPAKEWRAVVRELEPVYEEDAGGVRISPDGKQLVFASARSGVSQIYLQPADGGPPRLIGPGTDGADHPSWSSDGGAVYFSRVDAKGDHIERMPLRPPGPPVEMVSGKEAVECAGRLFYLRGPDSASQAMVRERDGSERELTRSSSGIGNLVCARDGRRIAYTFGYPERVAWLDVYAAVAHPLPPLGEYELNPAFHPDGHTLLVEVIDRDRHALWEQRLDGSRARPLTDGGHYCRPEVSPDGRRLFLSLGGATRLLGAHPLDGRPARHLGTATGWSATVPTPDGKELVAARPTGSAWEVVALAIADDSERVLSSGNAPVLSPDGANVYFVDDGDQTLFAIPLAGGARRTVARLPARVEHSVAGVDALHLALGREPAAWRQPYDGSAGAPEGATGVKLVLPAADGWSIAWSERYRTIVVGPGPWPKPLPAETRFWSGRLTADRRAFVGFDDDNLVWRVEIATGKERKLAQVPGVWSAVLSTDETTLYTIEETRRTRRAELVNYAERPAL